MSIKRYHPRYKKLTKFRPPLWFDRKQKFLHLTREKWSRLTKSLFKRKFKCFYQDVLSVSLNRKYYGRKSRRYKRTFKFNLRNKQRVQLFYSNDRLKHFQLKALTRKSIKIANNRKLVKPTVFMSLLENRLFNLVYRLGFVRSFEQGKRIVASGHFKVEDNEVKNYNFTISQLDFVQLDPKILYLINFNYIKYNHSFFYYKRRKKAHKLIVKKVKCVDTSNASNNIKKHMFSLKALIKKVKICTAMRPRILSREVLITEVNKRIKKY